MEIVKYALIAVDIFLLCQLLLLHHLLSNTFDESKGSPPLLRISRSFFLLAQIIVKVQVYIYNPKVKAEDRNEKERMVKERPQADLKINFNDNLYGKDH